MKNNLRSFLTVSAFCLIFLGSMTAFGQIRTGGYKTVSVSDAGVEGAANFAVETKSEEFERELLLETIHKAETQTVAGTNYRLCLEILFKGEDEDDGDIFFIKTVIFKNLKGEYKITSWDEADECGEK